MHVRYLCHRYDGYGQTTTRQILDHLYVTYANISPADLQRNDARLRYPYDVNHPVENLFDQVETAVEYAAAGDTPYTHEKVVAIAFQLLLKTGFFLDKCKTWKRNSPADKTWENFKVYFIIVHLEWRETQVTTADAGFQSANHDYQQDKVDKIANIAKATASGRASVSALTATKSTLTAEVAASHAKLVNALMKTTKLTSTISKLRRKPVGSTWRPQIPKGHCCWTYGYRIPHSSFKFPTPVAGHEPQATKMDTKKGSTTNNPT